MIITLNVNTQSFTLDVEPGDTLFKTLRSLGYYSVKFGS